MLAKGWQPQMASGMIQGFSADILPGNDGDTPSIFQSNYAGSSWSTTSGGVPGTLKTGVNGVNGIRCVRFAPTSNTGYAGIINLVGASGFSVFMVVRTKTNTNGAITCMLSSGGPGATPGIRWQQTLENLTGPDAGVELGWVGPTGAIGLTTGQLPAANTVYVLGFVYDKANWKIYGGMGTATIADTSFPTGSADWFIGHEGVASTRSFDGDLCEMFMFNIAVSNNDRNAIIGYLKNKWGA